MTPSAHIVLLATTHPVDDKRVGFKMATALCEASYTVSVYGTKATSDEENLLATTVHEWPIGSRRLRRALSTMQVARYTNAELIICPEIDSWIAAVLGTRFQQGPRRSKVWFDSHEHYPSRAFERLRSTNVLLATAAGMAISALIRSLASRTDTVIAASAGLAELMQQGGVSAVAIENYFLRGPDPVKPSVSPSQDADVSRRHCAAGVEDTIKTEGAARFENAPRIVHFGKIDYRMNEELFLDALRQVTCDFVLEEYGGDSQGAMITVGNCLWKKLPYVPRSELYTAADCAASNSVTR